ncbi:unnamed protein product [Ambrosiozyma monospora]|uniref:Unnamed protein product n=1 Tax=Ambrosiozyma monospora TaxID=43982 RepID=A0ACB5U7K8_AMBMO|nr:unnamed protein product [Ambrosiozyma monospora]
MLASKGKSTEKGKKTGKMAIEVGKEQQEQEKKDESDTTPEDNNTHSVLKELVESGFISLPSYKVSINSKALNQSPIKDVGPTGRPSDTDNIQIVKATVDEVLNDDDGTHKRDLMQFQELEDLVKEDVRREHRPNSGKSSKKGFKDVTALID